MRIDSRDCPLLAPELVQRCNCLVGAMERLQTDLPNWAQQTAAVELDQRMLQLAKQMKKRALRVGLVGPPASGKSLAICNLLQIPADQSPAPIGAADSDGPTSLTTLTLNFPEEGFSPEVASRAFMTEQQFLARAAIVASSIGLCVREEPLKALEEIEVRLARDPPSEQQHALSYLRRLLRAHAAHPVLWGQTFGVDECRYEQRWEYLRGGETDEDAFGLLREVVIDYPTERLPEDLNLVDIPGLATSHRVDDSATAQLIGSLDALLVFQRLLPEDQFAGVDLYNRLSEDLRSRRPPMWLVVTGWDAPDAMEGALLDRVTQAIAAADIAVSELLPLANRWSQAKIAEDESLRQDLGPAEMPPWFQKNPGWQELYHELTRDGGIGRLGRTLKNQVRDNAWSKHGELVQSGLAQAERDFRGLAHADRESSSLVAGASAVAATTELALTKLVPKLRQERVVSEQAAAVLIQKLDDQLDASLDGFCASSPPDVGGLHELVCCQLEELACAHAASRDGGTIARIFQAVDGLLEEARIPVVSFGPPGDENGALDVPAQWAQQRDKDLADASWATAVFHGFQQDEFDGAAGMQVGAYHSVMQRKIRCLVYALVVCVLKHVGVTFDKYCEVMRRHRSEKGGSTPRDRQVFEDILRELDSPETA